MQRARLGLIPAVLIPLAITVSGCNPGANSAGGTKPAAPAATTPPAVNPGNSAAPGGAGSPATPGGSSSDAITAPGTSLSLGDAATVKQDSGIVSVTLNSIDAGDPSDLDGVDFGDNTADVAGKTPYYLKFTVTGGDGSASLADSDIDGGLIDGVQDDGNQAAWMGITDFKPCDDPGYPSDFGPGKSVDLCLPVLPESGKTVVGVSYTPDGDQYQDNPITWKQ